MKDILIRSVIVVVFVTGISLTIYALPNKDVSAWIPFIGGGCIGLSLNMLMDYCRGSNG